MDLVLLTDYRGAIRQKQQIFESLDVARIRELLEAEGIRTSQYSFEEVVNRGIDLEGCMIHYTSTQDPGYRPFVDDVLFHLSRNNKLVPSYRIFRAHENKGFQELLKKDLKISSLPALYFGNEKGLDTQGIEISFPMVFKAARGFQSQAVSLVKSSRELRQQIRRQFKPAGLLKYRLKEFLKRNVLRGRYHPEMYEDCVYSGHYVLQSFIPGSAGDWKILIFGDHYFALRRLVNDGDFRASGSGRFLFETPPDEVLNYAREIFEKLDSPMASLDILQSDDGCHLIEFQGLHFGTFTIDQSPRYFVPQPSGWETVESGANLEQEYARSLILYLKSADSHE